MSHGKPVNIWLSKITEDQNLEQIGDITSTRMDGLRRWFASRVLQPLVIMGRYSPTQGKYVLGGGSCDEFTTEMSFTTASVATLTLTCAAGHRYRIYFAGAVNVTAASAVTGIATVNGTTPTYHLYNGVNSQVMLNPVIPAQGVGVSAVSMSAEQWLEAGETFALTVTTFAGGNNTEHVIMYEDYTL